MCRYITIHFTADKLTLDRKRRVEKGEERYRLRIFKGNRIALFVHNVEEFKKTPFFTQ